MKYLLYPILIGVISTVCYVLIFDKLFKEIILPWYINRKYNSTVISGNWAGKAGVFSFSFNIKQKGSKVFGYIVAQTKLSSQEDSDESVSASNKYKFNGEIRDGFVLINHREEDPKRFGFGSFVLQITGGGNTLTGSVVFVDENESMPIVSSKNGVNLRRVSGDI